MKKMFFATAVLLTVVLISCSKGQSKSESAKEYMKDQITNASDASNAVQAVEQDVKVLNERNFDQTISKGVVLVDFWATWCRPCRMQAPLIEELAKEYKGKVVFGKVDVDENRMLSTRFRIDGIPALMIFKNGVLVENLVGLQARETLVDVLNKHIETAQK